MWQSTVIPFGIVLLWTALKDLYEDRRRQRDDDLENFRGCMRYDVARGAFVGAKWCELHCGDIVWTSADEAFPADLLLLAAAGGQAFISTVNLDGETNLKERRPPDLCSAFAAHAGLEVPSAESELLEKHMSRVARFILEQGLLVKLGEPQPALTEMRGSVELATMSEPMRQTMATLKLTQPGPLMYEHFAPRGCVLRNTMWIVSIVAYPGDESKTRLNVASTGAKISNMQHYLNRCVQGLVVVLCLFCIYAAIMARFQEEEDEENVVVRFLIYWIVLYQIVPISLYVCFEIVKLALGIQINLDAQMCDPRTQQYALARTADLVEELGQVDFIFSDKTGTLTENEMVFARCCVQGNDVGDFRAPKGETAAGVTETQRLLRQPADDPRRMEIRWFFFCLVVCHGAQVDMQDGGEPVYSGSSPEEVAFLDAAHSIGITFQARRRVTGSTRAELHVSGPPGESTHVIKQLCDIPFTSDRKRMSVIIEYKGEYFCITKGADNVIGALCHEPYSEADSAALLSYSKQGLRTLAVASKVVPQDFLESWQAKWNAALGGGEDREGLMAQVAAEMEQSLMVSGISAIEDKLQLGVPEAITTVKAAGIRFWVLTGDKTETAVEIVRACRLFTDDMVLAYCITAKSMEEALAKLEDAKKLLRGTRSGGLILDGTTVSYTLQSDEARKSLFDLAVASQACVCCRLSPQQKRKLVELVKEQYKEGILLAIGDGANDVSMIQGAHVGIGVRGKEGNQAVQASDVAVSQFRFLVPLLFCHGRRAYRRVASYLCYYVYKHVVLAVADMIWAHQFEFKGEIAYPEWLSSAYSVLFTSLPVIVILSFDRDVPDEVANTTPSLYIEGLQRIRFNFVVFTVWMISGIWHGALAWLVPNLIIGSTDHDSEDFWLGSCVSFTLVIFLVDLRLWMISLNRFSLPTLGMLLLSVLAYFAVLFGLGYIMPSMQPKIEELPHKMFTELDAFLVMLLTPLALLIDLALFEGAKVFRPTPLDRARRSPYLAGNGGVTAATIGAPSTAAKVTTSEPTVVKPCVAW